MPNDTIISFEDYKNEWLQEITECNPTNVELGNRFAKKLVTQWLDIEDDNDDMIFCDGSGDGGIDIAYLKRSENENEGDTWYLVQSKYGTAFNSKSTLLIEAQKVIDTLDGQTKRLSSITNDLIERLHIFKKNSSSKDNLILVFATNSSISEEEKRALNDIKAIGKARLGEIFDTDSISIETIYQRMISDNLGKYKKYKIPFNANLIISGNDLLIGSIKLINIYQFLKDYKIKTGDIDLIYEKNVRKYLGKGKVNNAIVETLKNEPEIFGLYNNGITIVVENFETIGTDKFVLIEPYIVNGCQTTRTIYETLKTQLETGGTGKDKEIENYKNKLESGIVVVKIVKISENDNKLLTEITRYTNSQNAVGKKDFVALVKDFKDFAKQMKDTYNIYLETQRGGIDSIKIIEKQKHNTKSYDDYVNASSLLKTYGAAWLGEPGKAFGSDGPFAPPNGIIFNQIFENSINVHDLYAAYLLQRLTTTKFKFGRKAEKKSRSLTKYLFYYILGVLLKDCMKHSHIPVTNPNLSLQFINILSDLESDAANHLCESALYVIDEYLMEGDRSVFNEVNFSKSGDMNAYLKSGDIAKETFSPILHDLIEREKRALKQNNRGSNSSLEIIREAMTNNKQIQVTQQKIEEISISDVKIGEKYVIGSAGKNVFATGYKYNEVGDFLVLAGSTVSGTTAPTMPSGAQKIRSKCITDGTIVDKMFTKDFVFKSWSLAAAVILGSSKSGAAMWKRLEE